MEQVTEAVKAETTENRKNRGNRENRKPAVKWLIIGLIVFRKHYILTDEKLEEINAQLKAERNS